MSTQTIVDFTLKWLCLAHAARIQSLIVYTWTPKFYTIRFLTTSFHGGRDYHLRETVQQIQDSFESRDLDSLIKIQEILNIRDALAKKSILFHSI